MTACRDRPTVAVEFGGTPCVHDDMRISRDEEAGGSPRSLFLGRPRHGRQNGWKIWKVGKGWGRKIRLCKVGMPAALEVFRTPSYDSEQGMRTDPNMTILKEAISMPVLSQRSRPMAVSE